MTPAPCPCPLQLCPSPCPSLGVLVRTPHLVKGAQLIGAELSCSLCIQHLAPKLETRRAGHRCSEDSEVPPHPHRLLKGVLRVNGGELGEKERRPAFPRHEHSYFYVLVRILLVLQQPSEADVTSGWRAQSPQCMQNSKWFAVSEGSVSQGLCIAVSSYSRLSHGPGLLLSDTGGSVEK